MKTLMTLVVFSLALLYAPCAAKRSAHAWGKMFTNGAQNTLRSLRNDHVKPGRDTTEPLRSLRISAGEKSPRSLRGPLSSSLFVRDVVAKKLLTINFDELDRQWEDGDDEEDIKTESQLEFERLERRRKLESASAGSLDPSALNEMDAAQIGALAAGQKDATGPTMMFAKVGSGIGETGQPERGGSTITKEDTDDVAHRLQQMAFLGGLELSMYAIDPGSLLVSTQRGWEGKQILDFLLSRSEVTKVTWNSKDFLPPADDDEL